MGLMATTGKKLVKQMPGRIVGETLDAKGERGYVLTLATREQHIKRERATSNICTNQALVALAFSVHVSLLGHLGLERINNISHNRALKLLEGLTQIPGVTRQFSGPFLNEFALTFPVDVEALWRFMADRGVLFGVPMVQLCGEESPLKQTIIFATTETVEPEQIDRAVALAAEFYGKGAPHA